MDCTEDVVCTEYFAILSLQLYYTYCTSVLIPQTLTSLLMLSHLISLFLSCYCSGCHSLLYVSQVSWPSLCLIPLTSCQLWCLGCMLVGFTWDTSKGTHWLDLRVIQVMTSPSPVYSQLPWGTSNLLLFFPFTSANTHYWSHFWYHSMLLFSLQTSYRPCGQPVW